MLEVIDTNFSSMLAELTRAEDASEARYQTAQDNKLNNIS